MVTVNGVSSPVVELSRELFGDVSSFICTKKIDAEKIKKYDDILQILEERRDHWALNRSLPPIDSIKIYGGYSTLYNTLYGVAKALGLGIKRKENPKAAKEVYSILQSATELIYKLEKVHNEKQGQTQLIAEIFDSSRELRKQAISKQLIQVGETPNRKELINELVAELEPHLT